MAQQHKRSDWVKMGGVVVVAVALGFALAVMVTKKDQGPQPAAKPAAVSEAAKSSHEAMPTSEPTREQQLALVLLTKGAGRFALSGQAAIDGAVALQAVPDKAAVVDAPSGSRVYRLVQTAGQNDDAQGESVIAIADQVAYLGRAGNPVAFEALKEQALRVDLTTQWQKLWQNGDLVKLVGLISIGQVQDQAAVASRSVSSAPRSQTSRLDWAQMAGQFVEDEATVSDGAPQLTHISVQEGQWAWTAYHYGDGAPKYQYVLDNLADAGSDGKGGKIFAGHAIGLYNRKDVIDITFDLIDANTYTVRAKDINYYGKFNRQ